MALSQVLLDQEEYAATVTSVDRALELGVSRADALRIKHQALRALGRHASNPELSFTWYDAAVLSQKIRQTGQQAKPQRLRLPQID